MFPTANTLKCGVLVVVSEFRSHNWVVGLAYQRSLHFSNFWLELLVEHIGRDSALNADLNVAKTA